MKILILGNKDTTKSLLKGIIKEGVSVNSLATLDSNEASRFQISGLDVDLAESARRLGTEVFYIDDYSCKNGRFLLYLREQKFDIAFVTGWQRLLPAAVLGEVKYGFFGWHGSPFSLPDGKGRSPMNWALRLGQGQILHHMIRYSAGVDDGEIVDVGVIKIKPADSIGNILDAAVSHMIKSSLSLIRRPVSDWPKFRTQRDGAHIVFPKLSELDGLVTSSMTCFDAFNLIRSCSRPFPGAFVLEGRNAKVRVWSAAYETSSENQPEYHIQCADGVLYSNEYEIEYV